MTQQIPTHTWNVTDALAIDNSEELCAAFILSFKNDSPQASSLPPIKYLSLYQTLNYPCRHQATEPPKLKSAPTKMVASMAAI